VERWNGERGRRHALRQFSKACEHFDSRGGLLCRGHSRGSAIAWHSTGKCADDHAAWPDERVVSPMRQAVASTRRDCGATRSWRAASDQHRASRATHHRGHCVCRHDHTDAAAANTRSHPADRGSVGTNPRSCTYRHASRRRGSGRWTAAPPIRRPRIPARQLGQPLVLHGQAACTRDPGTAPVRPANRPIRPPIVHRRPRHVNSAHRRSCTSVQRVHRTTQRSSEQSKRNGQCGQPVAPARQASCTQKRTTVL
jgi:hypothetical protein